MKSAESKFFTDPFQLASIGIVAVGDTACKQAEQFSKILHKHEAIYQVGVVALVKISTEVYEDAKQIAKRFPKKERHKVVGICAKNTTLIRELEKSEEFAESKRGVWLPKLKDGIDRIVELLETHQVSIVVVYLGSGGHATLGRELITILKERYTGVHFVVVLCKPYHDKLCEPIYKNNQKFVVKGGTLSVIFESELVENSFEAKDIENNTSLFALLNERKTATNKSAPDMLRLMEAHKQYVIKTAVRSNPIYRKQGLLWDTTNNHRDVTTDTIVRGIKEIGICQDCLYVISGRTTDGQIKNGIMQIGKGGKGFDLNYRLLPTEKNDTLLIGKFEPC
ncbi:MAG: hypothetical protein KGH89_07795 [Thaumarchaeota archaeon]|nr:hypothetical protein [Nitrososphaerota archaeon]MDE1867729.1 hypothetical protein [Nitrososphaerota archaeon]